MARGYEQGGEMAFPSDVQNNEWNHDNLQVWSDPQVTNLAGLQLAPLEAKALHVVGTLVQVFNSVGYVLYCGQQGRPYADYYLYAYLLACTAIEFLGRCQDGEQSITRSTLRCGLENVGLQTVTVNVRRGGKPSAYVYNEDMLVALRNLAAHGQAVASAGGRRQKVILHVELLDSFPGKLAAAFDSYYTDLFQSAARQMRRMLALAAVEPVLYSDESGQVYVSPIKYAYKRIYQPGKQPSEVLMHTDWQVYNPERDRHL
jgi:hypothetical protein